MVCGGEGEGGRCRSEGVTYVVDCSRCDSKYIGETARNAFTRGLEHRAAVTKKDTNSPLYAHSLHEHAGTPTTYNMRVTGVFGGDALKRQITESVQIQSTPAHSLLNRRDEWRHVVLPRIDLCLE